MTGVHGTLWLHVGTHKTGTTSIQQALRLRTAELAEVGVANHEDYSAWKLANAFLRPSLVTTPRMQGHPLPDLPAMRHEIGRVRRCLGQHRSMIISSEAFCLYRDPLEAFALTSALAALPLRIVPIIVLRDETDWRASREDQLRKSGVWLPQSALPDAASTNGEWYYDRAAALAFWQTIGEVVVIDYDAEMRKDGTILQAFARAIGQDGIFDGLDLRVNPSRWRMA